jgi:hypothetical protein
MADSSDVMKLFSNEMGFFEYQNEIIDDAYESIGQSYSNDSNEVTIVTNLVNALNGKTFNNDYCHIHLSAAKIHGSRSYVEFNYRDKPTTKELGDMAVISLITNGKTRLFQRICIIQNKKAVNQSWVIDQEQLFLLKNFPPFNGQRGIFRRQRKVNFRNRSGCLGAFGLFYKPGDMIFISAQYLEVFLHHTNTLSASDIEFPPSHRSLESSIYNGYFGMPHQFSQELFHHTYFHYGNFRFGYDFYDFIKAWTQINLGEITVMNKIIVNSNVDSFANQLILNAGLGDGIDFPRNERNDAIIMKDNMAVFLFHVDMGLNKDLKTKE